MIYKVWIQIEQIDESRDHYVNIGLPYQAGVFDTETEAANFIENELLAGIPDESSCSGRHCKNNLAKTKMLKTTTIKEQCPDCTPVEIKVNILSEGGKIWIQPQGYGEKCALDGHGWPVGIEVWQGSLRLIIFDNINSEEPRIIGLEKARESCRCNCMDYCKAAEYLAGQGRKFFTGPMKGGLWNARCLDACIMSKKQDDKAAYEFLLGFGDKYIRDLPEDKKLQWQMIKDASAALLKPAQSIGNTNQSKQ